MRRPISTRRAAAVVGLPLILAACGPAATPSIPAGVPGSVAPSTGLPSASPAPSGSALAGGSVPERVVALLQSDSFVGHVDQVATGTSVAGSKSVHVNVTLSLDVNGADLSAHLSGTSADQTIDSDIVIVGTTAYVRSKGGEWQTAPRAAVASSVTSLITALTLVTSASQLKDLGVESVDGRSLHHLTAASTIPYTTSSGTVGRYDTFEFYVEDDGTPVLFKSSFTGTQGGTTISGTTELRYSRIGGPITIVPPAVAPSAKP